MALMARSKSVPFLEQPAALDGSLPGDVGMFMYYIILHFLFPRIIYNNVIGFDPVGFSGAWLDKDWLSREVHLLVNPGAPASGSCT